MSAEYIRVTTSTSILQAACTLHLHSFHSSELSMCPDFSPLQDSFLDFS